MIKKILLINPNFYYFPGWMENIMNYKRPILGLAYLAAIAKKYPVDVKICDAALLNINENQVFQGMQQFKPDIIGITVTTITVKSARSIAIKAHQMFPEVFIIFGGPHITALPFENLDVADVCVIGEGEETFAELIDKCLKNNSWKTVAGIAFRKNSADIIAKERALIEDLDKIPFPARELVPRSRFQHIYPYRLKNKFYDTLLTSRGCASQCNFCLNELMWKKRVRFRSLDNVFEEIELLIKDHCTSLLFISDDNFTSWPERVIEFSRRKQKYFPELKWICHSRADCLSLDLLKEMEAGGCIEIQIGVESGDDKILDACNKDINSQKIFNAFQLFKKTKINSWATFIIGNEGETKESIEKTIAFSKKIDPVYSTFLFLSPLPGSKCFKHFKDKGYIKTYDWAKYSWHGEPVFETETLSKNLLLNLRKKAYIQFYLRPRSFRYFWPYIVARQWRLMFSNALLLLKFILGKIRK